MRVSVNGVRVDRLYQPKTVRVFRNRTEEIIKRMIPSSHKVAFSLAIGTMIADILFSGGMVTSAASTGPMLGVADLSSAFEPVKRLLIDIADPLCYVMFVWGCIECIVGRAASGLNRMKYAAIGYIAINWIPVVMQAIRAATPGA